MLILVTGLPGSGKSTVSRILAAELNAQVLNSDVTRRELFPETRTYSSQETQTVIQETERYTKELLTEGKIVILDALFTKQRPRDEYRKLAQEVGAPYRVVYVVAPEEDIEKRLALRQAKGDASEATFEYYLDRKPHFVPVQGDHYIIQNTGNEEALEESVRKVAANLAAV